MAREQPSTLARYLFAAYLLLIIFASLYPFPDGAIAGSRRSLF